MGALRIPAAGQAVRERDLYAWCGEQANLLRELKPEGIDWQNIAEELESLEGRDRRELFRRIEVVVAHLLKWQTRIRLGGAPSQSWRSTLTTQRGEVDELLQQSPALRRLVDEALRGRRYSRAVQVAAAEMRMSPNHFPAECPFTLDQILNIEYYPN